MSQVLRPSHKFKKATVVEIKDVHLVQENTEKVIQPISGNASDQGVLQPLENTPQEKRAEGISLEEKSVLDSKEISKEEQISLALQQLLDRKIEKAIANAEISLGTPDTNPSTESTGSLPAVLGEVPSGDIIVSTNLQQNLPITSQVEQLPIRNGVVFSVVPGKVNETPSTVLPQEEIIKNLGQEIRIPINVAEIKPALETTVPVAVIPIVPQVTQPLQTTQSSQVVPVVEVVTPVVTVPLQQVVTAPQPIIVEPAKPPVPQVASFSHQVQNVSVTPPLDQPKTHWFDKIFGSTPKNPPQSA